VTEDFNINMQSQTSRSFPQILQRLNMENVVHEPTHVTTDLGTCIDLCITDVFVLQSVVHTR